jgi:uroporphyrinogen-III synthase
MSPELKLAGLNVVSFESRLAQTMADLIALHGGNPVSAPSMKEAPLESNVDAFSFAEKLFDGKIDLVIFLTGVGARTLVEALETRHPKEKILEALRKVVVVPRGPKPIRVLKEFHVPFALTVPEPNTWKELLAALDAHPDKAPLKNKTVAVQEYGLPNENLLEGLKSRGAEVLRVPVYRWTLPDHLEPLKKAISQILNGEIQAAIFTTAVQIVHVLKVAKQMGRDHDLQKAFEKMVVASVGPDCAESLTQHGIHVDIQPAIPKMGPLVLEVAHQAKKILQSRQ